MTFMTHQNSNTQVKHEQGSGEQCTPWLAVVVLYKIRLSDSRTYQSLMNSWLTIRVGERKMRLLVYDNSPEDYQEAETSFSAQLAAGFEVKYIRDTANPGVSKAYNVGAAFARSAGLDYLMLLDQDTQLPNDYLPCVATALASDEGHQLICPVIKFNDRVISPAGFFLHRSVTLKQVKAGVNILKKMRPINSGLIIKLDLFEKVGGYDEAFSLDYSDHYFIHKLKAHWQYLFVMDCDVNHSLSSNELVPLPQFYNRFETFLKSTRAYMRKTNQVYSFFWLAVYILKRSVMYRTTGILRYAIRNYK